MTITTDVENYPGFLDVIQGPWLMEQMQKQAEHVGARMVSDTIVKLDLAKRPSRRSAIRATPPRPTPSSSTGASARWLGIESEKKCRPGGVSACATCDGFFPRRVRRDRRRHNRRSRKRLYSDQPRDQGYPDPPARFAARGKDLQKRMFEHPKVEAIWDSVVDEVLERTRRRASRRARAAI